MKQSLMTTKGTFMVAFCSIRVTLLSHLSSWSRNWAVYGRIWRLGLLLLSEKGILNFTWTQWKKWSRFGCLVLSTLSQDFWNIFVGLRILTLKTKHRHMLSYGFACHISLESIGGKPLCLKLLPELSIDEATHSRLFGHYARVLVDDDMSDTLFETVLVEREGYAFSVNVEYERRPAYFPHCKW